MAKKQTKTASALARITRALEQAEELVSRLREVRDALLEQEAAGEDKADV